VNALDRLLCEVTEEAIAVIEGVLDEERIDYDECAAMHGYPLCGAAPCQNNGCLVDKRKRAIAALAKARGEAA
jgi:hypothetical protein